MIVITGTQRSGTSMIAQALQQSGYDLGSTLWDEEVQGGLENDLICGFYRSYLGDPTFPFDDFDLPVVSRDRFAFLDYKVVKFSYLLMNPTLVRIWHKFRPPEMGDVFLVMDRNKGDVVASKRRHSRRFAHDSAPLSQGPNELYRNFTKSLVLLGGRYPFEVLQFPQCVGYPVQRINKILAKLDPSVQIDEGVWEQVADPSKVHFKQRRK